MSLTLVGLVNSFAGIVILNMQIMNGKSKILTGAIGGTILVLIISKLLFGKTRIAKRSQQLEAAIDKTLYNDKRELEQTRDMLEMQLEKVNQQLDEFSS